MINVIGVTAFAKNNQGQGMGNSGENSDSGNGATTTTTIDGETQSEKQKKAGTKEELKEMIQERREELNQELEQVREQNREMHQNQNQVRLTVHTLLAMENLTGGIGQNVSAVAIEFNNSFKITVQAEERIQNRNQLIRFCFGGDDEAADEIQGEIEQNQLRIQRLYELLEQCECDEEIKDILREQIQTMEQEQNRLQEKANNEKSYKGLFGWIWKK